MVKRSADKRRNSVTDDDCCSQKQNGTWSPSEITLGWVGQMSLILNDNLTFMIVIIFLYLHIQHVVRQPPRYNLAISQVDAWTLKLVFK